MITVNMHEAQTRLFQLVNAVEEEGETVILQRNGVTVAELIPIRESSHLRRDLIPPDPALRCTFAPDYDPTEPATEDEWPEENR